MNHHGLPSEGDMLWTMVAKTRKQTELREHLEGVRADTSKYSQSLEYGSVSSRAGTAVPIFVHAVDSSAYGLGELLVDVDRELRRCLTVIDGSARQRRTTRQNLQVVAARDGQSIDVVLASYHVLAGAILSDPLQLIMSLEWLWDRRPIRWGVTKPPAQRTFEEISSGVMENADVALQAGHSVAYLLQLDADGSMSAQFVASPGELPPIGPIKPTPIESPKD
jgi:hypothetical protein